MGLAACQLPSTNPIQVWMGPMWDVTSLVVLHSTHVRMGHHCPDCTADTNAGPHAAPVHTLLLPNMPTHRAVSFFKAMPIGKLRSDGVYMIV
jgi:hypothetical protein